MFKYLAFGAVGLVAGSASADELTAIQGGSIDLGTYQGVVYYVEEGDDFNVVTTLASADSGMPLRFVVTLSEDEHFLITAPGAVVRGSLLRATLAAAPYVAFLGGELHVPGRDLQLAFSDRADHVVRHDVPQRASSPLADRRCLPWRWS